MDRGKQVALKALADSGAEDFIELMKELDMQ